MNSRTVVESLSASDLLSATRELVQQSRGVEAELLVHLGEIDERKLYLDRAFSSMFAFCVGELGFSEDAACNRINVARAARRLPVILEAVRSGQVHLAGLRLRAPHLTTDNQCKVSSPALAFAPPPAPAPRRDESRAVIAPLSEETFKFQFTASRECRDKFRQAQDLLRHRIPDGDLATIFEKALDLLIEEVKKERFATGRKARQVPIGETDAASSRHIPDAIKREVFERDGGRCTFADERGRRCAETGALADVRSRVHGTSARIARPAPNSCRDSFRVSVSSAAAARSSARTRRHGSRGPTRRRFSSRSRERAGGSRSGSRSRSDSGSGAGSRRGRVRGRVRGRGHSSSSVPVACGSALPGR